MPRLLRRITPFLLPLGAVRGTFFPLALAVCALVVPGCAGAPGIECHGTDWYQLGQRDGTLNARGQGERYAASCGSDFDTARYQEGFQEGFGRRAGPFVQGGEVRSSRS